MPVDFSTACLSPLPISDPAPCLPSQRRRAAGPHLPYPSSPLGRGGNKEEALLGLSPLSPSGLKVSHNSALWTQSPQCGKLGFRGTRGGWRARVFGGGAGRDRHVGTRAARADAGGFGSQGVREAELEAAQWAVVRGELPGGPGQAGAARPGGAAGATASAAGRQGGGGAERLRVGRLADRWGAEGVGRPRAGPCGGLPLAGGPAVESDDRRPSLLRIPAAGGGAEAVPDSLSARMAGGL